MPATRTPKAKAAPAATIAPAEAPADPAAASAAQTPPAAGSRSRAHIGSKVREQPVYGEAELRLFRKVMDLSSDEIFITDRDTMRFVDVNATACLESGYSRAELLGMGPADVWRIDRAELERAYDAVIQAGEAGITARGIGKPKNSSYRPVMEVHRLGVQVDGRWLILTTARDISQRVRTEQSTQRISHMFAALSATNEAIMRATSPESLYQEVCDAAVDGDKFHTAGIVLPDPHSGAAVIHAVAGPSAQHLARIRISLDPETPEGRGLVGTAFNTGQPCISNRILSDERTRPWWGQARAAGIAAGAAVPLLKGGRAIGALLFYSREEHTFDDDIVKLLERMAANVVFALGNFEHEAERRRGQARIDYLASHDSLTSLPNRAMFNEVLNLAIETAHRYQRAFAVMHINLDRFKLINDSLGYQAGDQLLQETATRLKSCLRSSDVVARLGGDDFVILLQESTDTEQASTVARKVLTAVMKPLTLMNQECRLTASVGISMFPADAQDEPSLMKKADLALSLAKEEGKNNHQFYSASIKSQSLERLTLETHLRRALERDEFSLHYQPKMDLRTGTVSGVEALLRWYSPELGHVSPALLIPVAEETGLIVALGKWVLQTACAQSMAWQRQGLPPVCMAVNLSARQFADPFLLQDVSEVLQETGLEPRLLELEITEGMVIQHPEKAVKLLNAIKAMGVRLALDDFGTGYSSLGQLKRFPLDTLKVDRSFIRDIPSDGEDCAITQAVIAMGKTLSLTVVAEGVENEQQQDFLRSQGCDQIQGYFFSKPVPAPQCAQLLGASVPA